MRLLFDANLSPKLVSRLAELFPDSVHVFDTKINRFVIVTADSNFLGLAEERGAPPNYRTKQVEDLLRRNAVRIAELERSPRPVLIIRNTV